MRKIMILSTVSLLVFLTGCAATSPFPTNGSQALKSESEFGVLTAQPDVYQGRAIKLAGRIVGVEPNAQGTIVTAEWLPYPDAEYLGPYHTTTGSAGRFVVFYPGKLDPEGMAYGNKFLVLGKRGNDLKSAFKSAPGSLPYIDARCLHVWNTGNDDIDMEPDSEYAVYPTERTYCSKT